MKQAAKHLLESLRGSTGLVCTLRASQIDQTQFTCRGPNMKKYTRQEYVRRRRDDISIKAK